MREKILKIATIGLVILVGAGFFFTPSTDALSKEDLIKEAYQEMLDRDPFPVELSNNLENFLGYENLRSYLNQVSERRLAINLIYSDYLNRAPQQREYEFHIRTGNPANKIKKQLIDSEEREQALNILYENILNRLPQINEVDFLNRSRVRLSLQEWTLLNSDERVITMNDLASQNLGRDAYQYERILFNDTSVSETSSGDYSFGSEVEEYYQQEEQKSNSVYYVDDDNWGSVEDGTPDNPYHRIYRALEEVPKWSTIIVREGEYREGSRGVPVGVDVFGEGADKTKLYMELNAYSRSTISNIHFKGESVRLSLGKTPIVKNCVVSFSEYDGIDYYGNGTPVIVNNTIVGNESGLSFYQNSKPIVFNNIIAVNDQDIP